MIEVNNIVISDSIEAGALEGYGDDGNRAVLAIQAGVDLILASARNVSQGEMIYEAIRESFSTNTTGESFKPSLTCGNSLTLTHRYRRGKECLVILAFRDSCNLFNHISSIIVKYIVTKGPLLYMVIYIYDMGRICFQTVISTHTTPSSLYSSLTEARSEYIS